MISSSIFEGLSVLAVFAIAFLALIFYGFALGIGLSLAFNRFGPWKKIRPPQTIDGFTEEALVALSQLKLSAFDAALNKIEGEGRKIFQTSASPKRTYQLIKLLEALYSIEESSLFTPATQFLNKSAESTLSLTKIIYPDEREATRLALQQLGLIATAALKKEKEEWVRLFQCQLVEAAKEALEKEDSKGKGLFIIGIVQELEKIALANIQFNKNTPINLLSLPFYQIKEKLMNHLQQTAHHLEIQAELERILADFSAISAVLRQVPNLEVETPQPFSPQK